MLDKYKFIDKTRVAVSGVSYGGYVAGMMLSATSTNHSDLLKCGIAVSPVVDWRYYGKKPLVSTKKVSLKIFRYRISVC